jgi:hypothetical protein
LVARKRDDLDVEARTLRVDEKVVEVRGRFERGSPKTVESERTVDLPVVVISPLAEQSLRFPPLRARPTHGSRAWSFYGEHAGSSAGMSSVRCGSEPAAR